MEIGEPLDNAQIFKGVKRDNKWVLEPIRREDFINEIIDFDFLLLGEQHLYNKCIANIIKVILEIIKRKKVDIFFEKKNSNDIVKKEYDAYKNLLKKHLEIVEKTKEMIKILKNENNELAEFAIKDDERFLEESDSIILELKSCINAFGKLNTALETKKLNVFGIAPDFCNYDEIGFELHNEIYYNEFLKYYNGINSIIRFGRAHIQYFYNTLKEDFPSKKVISVDLHQNYDFYKKAYTFPFLYVNYVVCGDF